MRLRFAIRVLAIGFLISICAVSFRLGILSNSRRFNIGGLAASEDALEVGDVWEQSDFTRVVRVTNETSRTIMLKDVLTSCSCASIEPRSLAIPGRAQGELRVLLDLAKAVDPSSKAHSRPFAVTLIPVIDEGPAPTAGWTIRGWARRPFQFEPPFVDFGEFGNDKPFSQATVHVVPSPELVDIQADCPDLNWKCMLTPFPAAASGPCQLTLGPLPSLQAGTHYVAVRLRAKDENHRLVSGFVGAKCRILDDVWMDPPDMRLGARELGEEIRETITLQSRSAKPFKVVALSQAPDSVRIEPRCVADDATTAFSLTLKVTRLGHQTFSIKFLVRDKENSRPREFDLPVFYHGIPALRQKAAARNAS
jgi:hypothetical protein